MPLKTPVSPIDHRMGNDQAPLKIVEYGDYQCPHCARAHPVVQRLQEVFGEQLQFVFRNFPLQKIHPDAMMAAIASEAADRQGQFWPMHHLLFENQDYLEADALLYYANELGLDIDRFKTDLVDPQLFQKVEDNFEDGIRSGVNATPTFFINGEKYNNGWESDRMEKFIKQHYPLP